MRSIISALSLMLLLGVRLAAITKPWPFVNLERNNCYRVAFKAFSLDESSRFKITQMPYVGCTTRPWFPVVTSKLRAQNAFDLCYLVLFLFHI